MRKILCFVLLWLYDQFLGGFFFYQFTHILQGCFTGTGQSTTISPVPVQSSWRIWVKYYCPNASGVILKNMGKSFRYSTTTKHNKAWTVCIYFLPCSVYTSNSFHSTGVNDSERCLLGSLHSHRLLNPSGPSQARITFMRPKSVIIVAADGQAPNDQNHRQRSRWQHKLGMCSSLFPWLNIMSNGVSLIQIMSFKMVDDWLDFMALRELNCAAGYGRCLPSELCAIRSNWRYLMLHHTQFMRNCINVISH